MISVSEIMRLICAYVCCFKILLSKYVFLLNVFWRFTVSEAVFFVASTAATAEVHALCLRGPPDKLAGAGSPRWTIRAGSFHVALSFAVRFKICIYVNHFSTWEQTERILRKLERRAHLRQQQRIMTPPTVKKTTTASTTKNTTIRMVSTSASSHTHTHKVLNVWSIGRLIIAFSI